MPKYPCVVIEDDGTELYYVLADVFLTGGASGAPLINSQGEVVGIHIASGGSTRYGVSKIKDLCRRDRGKPPVSSAKQWGAENHA